MVCRSGALILKKYAHPRLTSLVSFTMVATDTEVCRARNVFSDTYSGGFAITNKSEGTKGKNLSKMSRY